MYRKRNAKIVATLGPSSADPDTIRALFEAGADVFRLNFSHGSHDDHRRNHEFIRRIERELSRPVGILIDLQGPKLRLGTFAAGPVRLEEGAAFRLDLDTATAGDAARAPLPHPEIFAALEAGTDLLIDDGRVRLRVEACGPDFAQTRVIAGGTVSDRKGVNVPGVVLPLSALTAKDKADLAFGLALGVDWVALSFVQRAEDISEIKAIVQGQAGIVAKLEKPMAILSLDPIVETADAIMVARGDLGVEMPPEQVPTIQKRIVRACRKAGKPVIVATQMLESMISAPVPTRAEASDVATAIYDGADAVMLSAESASGRYPVEAVRMMSGIIAHTEADPHYREGLDATRTPSRPDAADAIGAAMRCAVSTLPVAASVAYTTSGYSALRMARERPQAPIIGMTPKLTTARRLALAWSVYPVLCPTVLDVREMSDLACHTAHAEGFGASGAAIAIVAGLPFGTPGTTNLLRIAHIN